MNLPGYDSYLEAPYQRACDEEEKAAKLIEEYDDFAGWLEWLSQDPEDFEIWCFENHWNALKWRFARELHPDAVSELDQNPDDAMNDNWALWNLFLFKVLDDKTLEPIVEKFVQLNRKNFEEWCIS